MYKIRIKGTKKRYFERFKMSSTGGYPYFVENEGKVYKTKTSANKDIQAITKLLTKITTDNEQEAKSRLMLDKIDA